MLFFFCLRDFLLGIFIFSGTLFPVLIPSLPFKFELTQVTQNAHMSQIQVIARAISWIPLTLCAISALPQIIKNYKLKSTQGLSPLMLLLLYSGILSTLFYMFLLDLPLSYKTAISLQFCFATILIYQELLYTESEEKRNRILLWHSLITIGICGLLLLNPVQYETAGIWLGWFAFGTLSLCQLPQMYKVWKQKSTRGFSLLYVTILASGALSDLLISIVLGIPLPSLLNTGRALFYYLIYFYQFFLYSDQDLVSSL